MNVFFDYQAFELQNIGGVSRSYAELISQLSQLECNCKLGIKESDNVYLRECGVPVKVKPLHYTHSRLFEGKKLFIGQRYLTRKVLEILGHQNGGLNINQEYCIKQLKRKSFDVFEPTFFDSYFLPYLKGKPFVMTIHDMIPELLFRNNQNYDFQIVQKKLLCPLAARIHVPSNTTKEDLVRILNIPPDKITVIPHGRPEFIPSDYSNPPLFDYPYLLYVGDRAIYKNYSKFIKECSYIIQKHPDIHVVCTGIDFSKGERSELVRLGIDNNVLHHFASAEDMRNLYHYAVAFVFPSAYEGFGLPILESFTSDCPVMLNNASCFPEVAGDAAIYFDINKDGDFCDKFIEFYSSGIGLRQEMIQRGRKRAGLFSWERSSEMLRDLYNSIL